MCLLRYASIFDWYTAERRVPSQQQDSTDLQNACTNVIGIGQRSVPVPTRTAKYNSPCQGVSDITCVTSGDGAIRATAQGDSGGIVAPCLVSERPRQHRRGSIRLALARRHDLRRGRKITRG